jgi:hypothetical protein
MIRYPGYAPCAPSFNPMITAFRSSCCATPVCLSLIIIGGVTPLAYVTGL